MLHTLKLLNYPVVCGVALAGFLLGWLWYSPLLFVRPWIKEMKFAEADLKMKPSKGVMMMVCALLMNVVSTAVIAVLITEHQMLVEGHPSLGALGGAKVGLFVGAGLVAIRHATNHMFQMKSFKLFLIVAGYDVALCTLQGALLGQWLWPK